MAYNGRRGPNMSAYLRDLNVQESARDDGFADDAFLDDDYKKELDLFTNTTFFDLDYGQQTNIQAPPPKPAALPAVAPAPLAAPAAAAEPPAEAPENGLLGDFRTNLEFMGDLNFGGFNNETYASPTIPDFPENLANIQPLQPLQPGQQQAAFAAPLPLSHPQRLQHPQHPQPLQQPGFVPQHLPPRGVVTDHRRGSRPGATSPISPVGVQPPTPGLPLQQPSPSFEDLSRAAAEDDKRRRNTAASARFRIKKKQREQALEKAAKESAEKVQLLESRITSLQTENEWLRTLLTQKHGSGRSSQDLLAKLLKGLPGQASKKGKEKEKEKEAPAEEAPDGGSGDSGSGSGSGSESSLSSDDAPPPPKKSKRKD